MTSSSLLHFESPAVATKKDNSTPNKTTSSSSPAVIKTAPPCKKSLSSWLDSLEFTKGKSLSEESLIMAEQDPILPKDSSINDNGCCHRCCPRVFYAIIDACIYTFCLVKNVEPTSPEEVYQNPPEEEGPIDIHFVSSGGNSSVAPVVIVDGEEDALLPVPVELLAADTPKPQPPQQQQPQPLPHSPHSPPPLPPSPSPPPSQSG